MLKKWMICCVLVQVIFSFALGSANGEGLTSASRERVVIIGGGVAGLAAASFLSDSPYEVYLLEKEKDLGGHAKTKFVDNGYGKNVEVDLGAQNFTEGPWDLYTQFVKNWGLYDEKNVFTFSPSATISKSGQKPHFVTPKLTKERLKFLLFDTRWSAIRSVCKVHKEAHRLYKGTERDYSGRIANFMDDLKLSERDRAEIFLPFLAGTLGVNIDQPSRLSTLAATELFAFDSSLGTKLHVFRTGMGTILKELGEKLEREFTNIHIVRGASVQDVTKDGNQYVVRYEENSDVKGIRADKIITAAHSPQVKVMFRNTFHEEALLSHLEGLASSYIRNRVVLHTSDIFDKGKLSSFINFEVNEEGNTFMTMQLGKINKEHYGHVRKSWVNDDKVYQRLKKSDSILAEETYFHPFVTSDYVKHRDSIRSVLTTNEEYANIAIAGGWMELNETQATAILSAYKAACRLFPQWMKEKGWETHLPALKSNS